MYSSPTCDSKTQSLHKIQMWGEYTLRETADVDQLEFEVSRGPIDPICLACCRHFKCETTLQIWKFFERSSIGQKQRKHWQQTIHFLCYQVDIYSEFQNEIQDIALPFACLLDDRTLAS